MGNFNCKEDIIYLIRHLGKLLQSDFEERVAQVGLTAAQARTMFFINRCRLENVVVHQKDIEQHFSLAKSTVNGLVQRLLKNGFISKNKDHPYPAIEITQLGIDTIAKIGEGRIETIDKLFKGYSEEERKIAIKQLNVLIDNLEGGDKDVT